MNDDIATRVCKLIAKIIPKENKKNGVTPDMELRTQLGVDSIGLMSIVFGLEEGFDVDLYDYSSQFIAASSVSHIIDIIEHATEAS